jgi:hypothetical protein
MKNKLPASWGWCTFLALTRLETIQNGDYGRHGWSEVRVEGHATLQEGPQSEFSRCRPLEVAVAILNDLQNPLLNCPRSRRDWRFGGKDLPRASQRTSVIRRSLDQTQM